MKVYPFIAAEKPAERNIIRSCAVLSVSRSAYYEWARQIPSAYSQEDERLRDRIGRIHTESRGTYGAPRIHQRLRQQGLRTARKRVARVMAEAGLCGRQKRRAKRTTIADGSSSEAGDLLQRGFSPEQLALDRAWVGDITYIRT